MGGGPWQGRAQTRVRTHSTEHPAMRPSLSHCRASISRYRLGRTQAIGFARRHTETRLDRRHRSAPKIQYANRDRHHAAPSGDAFGHSCRAPWKERIADLRGDARQEPGLRRREAHHPTQSGAVVPAVSHHRRDSRPRQLLVLDRTARGTSSWIARTPSARPGVRGRRNAGGSRLPWVQRRIH